LLSGAMVVKNNNAIIFIKAEMDKTWHIYSQSGSVGGPIKTHFIFFDQMIINLLEKQLSLNPVRNLKN
jgi:hypothetical protein